MGMPAARIGDNHVCPMVTPGTPPVPHVGGPILPPCAVTVLTGGIPQARVGDQCVCVGPPDIISFGAINVLVRGQPAARMGDPTVHGGAIVVGYPTVLIGTVPGGGAGMGGGIGGLGAPAVPAPPAAPAAAPGTGPLTEDELKQARQAVVDAKAMLAASRKKTEAWDADTKAQAKKWFGDDSDATKKMILDRIDKQSAHLDKMTDASFDRATGKFKDAYAYVYPNDDSKVYLGTAFWGAPATGDDSKAGTIVHEVSHYTSHSGTKDHVYGHDDAEKLAGKDPAKAQNNADNMEYYVENTGK